MGLNVDSPKQNVSGSSNVGNTASRAIANYELLSLILNICVQILKKCRIILINISREFKIDPEKCRELCRESFDLYLKKYPWYPLSPTLHKVLVHGHQIIKSSFLPVNTLGENVS